MPSELTVALLENGMYACIGEVSSHAPTTKYHISPVNLDKASLLPKRAWNHKLGNLKEKPEIEIISFLPATEIRRVVLERQ